MNDELINKKIMCDLPFNLTVTKYLLVKILEPLKFDQ